MERLPPRETMEQTISPSPLAQLMGAADEFRVTWPELVAKGSVHLRVIYTKISSCRHNKCQVILFTPAFMYVERWPL